MYADRDEPDLWRRIHIVLSGHRASWRLHCQYAGNSIHAAGRAPHCAPPHTRAHVFCSHQVPRFSALAHVVHVCSVVRWPSLVRCAAAEKCDTPLEHLCVCTRNTHPVAQTSRLLSFSKLHVPSIVVCAMPALVELRSVCSGNVYSRVHHFVGSTHLTTSTAMKQRCT